MRQGNPDNGNSTYHEGEEPFIHYICNMVGNAKLYPPIDTRNIALLFHLQWNEKKFRAAIDKMSERLGTVMIFCKENDKKRCNVVVG